MENTTGISSSTLEYDYVNYKPIGVPQRKLNGGLYTGEPFAKDALYANVPVLPAAAYWANENLKSSVNVPQQAFYQLQGDFRPGNNSTDPIMPELENIPNLNGKCINAICENKGYINDLNSSCVKNNCTNKKIAPSPYGLESYIYKI
jgi:hypothetical protein